MLGPELAAVGRKSEAGNEIRKRREVSLPATEFRGCTRRGRVADYMK